jgi:hypothetical protein
MAAVPAAGTGGTRLDHDELSTLCWMKAGLPADAGATRKELYVFEAEILKNGASHASALNNE